MKPTNYEKYYNMVLNFTCKSNDDYDDSLIHSQYYQLKTKIRNSRLSWDDKANFQQLIFKRLNEYNKPVRALSLVINNSEALEHSFVSKRQLEAV